MTQTAHTSPAPVTGLLAGLGAGLLAAFAMGQFQTLLGKAIRPGLGGTGEPATEKAADIVSKTLTGHALPKDRRAPAGETVHYVVGALVGGAYGLAAEYRPEVTAGHGAMLGVTAASVIDETAVVVTGLGAPPWKAPLTSHPYSYASHLVFGVVTEGARKLLRRFFEQVKAGVAQLRGQQTVAAPMVETEAAADRRTLALAFLLGATAGPRTSAPITAVTWAARLGWLDLKGTRLAFLASPWAAAVTTPMAISELVIDKLPATPHRTQPGAIAARAASGALSGAALGAGRSIAPFAALAGALGAVAGTLIGHAARVQLAKTADTDWPVAVSEDALAGVGALLVALASTAGPALAAPERARATYRPATDPRSFATPDWAH